MTSIVQQDEYWGPHQALEIRLSMLNESQQIANYLTCMEFLAHSTMSDVSEDRIVRKLQRLAYSFPSVDIATYINKYDGVLYSWIVKNILSVYSGEYLGTAYVLGGEIGLLPAMLLDTKLRIENLRCFDIDESCQFLADQLMQEEVLSNWRFKASRQDMFDINYEENRFQLDLPDGTQSDGFEEKPRFIVNTNLSELDNMEDKWYNSMIPNGVKMVLVGEAGFSKNLYKDQNTFNKAYTMSLELYNGMLTVNGRRYFMKIGTK